MNQDEPTVTRRQFVQTTTAIAAGAMGLHAASAKVRAQDAGVPARGDRTLKVALIGCGGRGCGAAINALAADRDAVLWSMADVFEDRLASGLSNIRSEIESRAGSEGENGLFASQIQVDPSRRFTGFDGYRQAIADCDVVLLAEPPHFRPRHLRAAIEAGRHVFCEKPVAVDAPGVRDVLKSVELAREKRLSLVSGFCWRYSARERETYERIQQGGIGDIRAIYTTYNAGGWVRTQTRQPGWSEMEYQLRSWHFFPWLSGDHIVEQACHSIDKIAWAMGDVMPVRCTAVGGRQSRDQVGEPGSAFDHFGATFDYENGARGFHMCRHFPNSPSDNSDTIMGSRGTCRVDGWADVHEITGESPWKSTAKKNDMYQQEHDELFAAIRSDLPINDGVRMANSTMMAIMARMAAYTAQTLTWEQALNSNEELKPSAYQMGDAPAVLIARPGLTPFR